MIAIDPFSGLFMLIALVWLNLLERRLAVRDEKLNRLMAIITDKQDVDRDDDFDYTCDERGEIRLPGTRSGVIYATEPPSFKPDP